MPRRKMPSFINRVEPQPIRPFPEAPSSYAPSVYLGCDFALAKVPVLVVQVLILCLALPRLFIQHTHLAGRVSVDRVSFMD